MGNTIQYKYREVLIHNFRNFDFLSEFGICAIKLITDGRFNFDLLIINDHNFSHFYKKIKIGRVFGIKYIKENKGGCFGFDYFKVVEIMDPNILEIEDKIIDIINVEKEFEREVYELIISKQVNFRLMIEKDEVKNINLGSIYKIKYRKGGIKNLKKIVKIQKLSQCFDNEIINLDD